MNFPSPIVRSSNPEGADHAQDAPDLRSQFESSAEAREFMIARAEATA